MHDELNDIMNLLSENARFALQKADSFSKRYNNGYMGTEYLLLGILAQDTSEGAAMLHDWGVTLEDMEKALNRPAIDVPNEGMMAMMNLSESTVLTLRIAHNFALDNGLDVIGTLHLLEAIAEQTSSNAAKRDALGPPDRRVPRGGIAANQLDRA